MGPFEGFLIAIPTMFIVAFLFIKYKFKINITPILTRLQDNHSIDTLDMDISFYRKSLVDLGFKYYGDFSVNYVTNQRLLVSIYYNESMTVTAYIHRSVDNKKNWLEFTSYEKEGIEINSSNADTNLSDIVESKKIYQYPQYFPKDLLDVHLNMIKEKTLREISKDGFESEIINAILLDNENKLKKGYVNKDRKEEFLIITFKYFLVSIDQDITKNRNIVKRSEYSSVESEPELKTKRWPLFTTYLVGFFWILFILLIGYKYYFLHPDPAGYFSFFWSFAIINITFFSFHSKEPKFLNIFSYVLYFLLAVVFLCLSLLTESVYFFMMLHLAILFFFHGFKKEYKRSPKMSPFVYVVLPVMMLSLVPNMFFLNSFYEFITIKPDEVSSITLYDYEVNDEDGSRDYQKITEVDDRMIIRAFVDSLPDTTPYAPNHEDIKKPFLVRIEYERKVTFLLLGKGNSANKDVVWVEFIKRPFTSKRSTPNGVYQNKKLVKVLEKLKIEKWK